MSGHGWVTPNPGGVVARCGGPALCSVCRKEAAEVALSIERRDHSLADQWKARAERMADLMEVAVDRLVNEHNEPRDCALIVAMVDAIKKAK